MQQPGIQQPTNEAASGPRVETPAAASNDQATVDVADILSGDSTIDDLRAQPQQTQTPWKLDDKGRHSPLSLPRGLARPASTSRCITLCGIV